MMRRLKSLYAFLNLAVSFIGHCLRKMARRPSPGLKTYLRNYQADGIVSLSLRDKESLLEFGRCIACGLCDSNCPVHTESPSFRPSALALSLSRGMPHFNVMNLDRKVCESCPGCEEICPTKVPLRRIIDFLTEKKRELSLS